MTDALDSLLLTYQNPQWPQRLGQIHEAVREATYFEDGSDADRSLTEIVQKVRHGGNQALAELTTSF